MVKPQTFVVMMGRERFTVAVTDNEISATSSGAHWVFDRNTKLPKSFEWPAKQQYPLYYSVDKSAVASQGLGAIKAIDGMGISIGRPMNGVGGLPHALDAIQKASSKPGFPQDAKDIIPELYTNIGQPVTQRSGP